RKHGEQHATHLPSATPTASPRLAARSSSKPTQWAAPPPSAAAAIRAVTWDDPVGPGSGRELARSRSCGLPGCALSSSLLADDCPSPAGGHRWVPRSGDARGPASLVAAAAKTAPWRDDPAGPAFLACDTWKRPVRSAACAGALT